MARPKHQWTAQLFSYGPTYTDGKIDGFHVNVRADDHTTSGRMIEIKLTASQLIRMAETAEAVEGHLGESGVILAPRPTR